MQKKISFALVALYLFPWGIQVLVDNFIPVYTSSLPFATEKTVGEVGAIGAIVTMIAQFLWTKAAGKIKDKSNALTLSLLLVAVFAGLFVVFDVSSKTTLLLLVTLFYSCYLTHQPLIDTIASDNYHKAGHPFGWFRSFASFGYAAMGFLFTFLPNDGNKFFIYVVILALVGAAVSRLVKSPNTYLTEDKKSSGGYMNKKFILFLVFSFVLFMCSRSIASFFAAYYCDENGLGGSVGVLSLMISIGTFAEWAVMIFFGRFIEKTKFKYLFLIIAIAGIFRSGVIFLIDNRYFVALTYVFSAIWYGFLWSSATPYIKKIVPESGFASAQGVWTVIAFGIAPFAGSYLSGVFAEAFGYRPLFLVVMCVMAGLSLVTPLLIKD